MFYACNPGLAWTKVIALKTLLGGLHVLLLQNTDSEVTDSDALVVLWGVV